MAIPLPAMRLPTSCDDRLLPATTTPLLLPVMTLSLTSNWIELPDVVAPTAVPGSASRLLDTVALTVVPALTGWKNTPQSVLPVIRTLFTDTVARPPFAGTTTIPPLLAVIVTFSTVSELPASAGAKLIALPVAPPRNPRTVELRTTTPPA